MSEEKSDLEVHLETAIPKVKYHNGFVVGAILGLNLQMGVRAMSREPLSARPIAYPLTMLGFGAFFFWYDYWRRCALEEIMICESERRYTDYAFAMNRIRIGDEENQGGVMEYLTT